MAGGGAGDDGPERAGRDHPRRREPPALVAPAVDYPVAVAGGSHGGPDRVDQRDH